MKSSAQFTQLNKHSTLSSQPTFQLMQWSESSSQSWSSSSFTLWKKSSEKSPAKRKDKDKDKNDNSSATAITHSEEEAFQELNILTRRWFLAYLLNTFVKTPIHTTFLNMWSTHSTYKITEKKVQNMFKTWKNRTLKTARLFINWYIEVEDSTLTTVQEFQFLKHELHQKFQHHWLDSVFKWAVEAVNFECCSIESLTFLQCELPYS